MIFRLQLAQLIWWRKPLGSNVGIQRMQQARWRSGSVGRCSAEASAMIGKLDACVRNVVATPWFVFTSSLSSVKRCADLAALRRTWPHEGRTRQSRRRQGAEKRKSGEAVHPCSDSACMEYLFTFTINLTQICRQLFTIPYMRHLGWRVWSTTNERPSETSDLLESWVLSVYIFFWMLLSTDLTSKPIVTPWQWRHDTIFCDMHWDALWWGSVIGGLLKDVGSWTPSIFFSCFFQVFSVFLVTWGQKAKDTEVPPEAKEAVDADMDMFG